MELTSFCKYFSSSKDVLEGVFERGMIRFTQPWGLNDPLEGTPAIRLKHNSAKVVYRFDGVTYPSEALFYRGQIIEASVNSFGMLSLTHIPDSFEMWALYGDGHRGFLLEFAENFNEHPCMRAKDGSVYPVEPIEYVDDYTIDPAELYDGSGLRHEALRRSVFLRKTRRWEHEGEYRMIRPLSDCPEFAPRTGLQTTYRDSTIYLFELARECIISVVLGAHMRPEHKRYICSHLVGSGIPILQACLVPILKDERGHYGVIVPVLIELLGPLDNVLDTPAQMFSVFDEDPREKTEYRDIRSLAELPYYERFPHIVEAFQRAMEDRKPK